MGVKGGALEMLIYWRKFCKLIFGVSKFSLNMPIYGEVGCYPLSIITKQRILGSLLLNKNIEK